MKTIICLSTSNYYPYPTRKQNVMNRLSGNRVLYFDPPVTYLAPLKDKSVKARLKNHQKPGIKAKEHITVYALPPVLPFANKYRWINRLNQKKLASYIKKVLAEQGITKPHLWCYSPSSADIIDHIDYQSLIYDCVDRHSAYTGFIASAVVDAMEKDLASLADTVFCTTRGLYDTLVQYNPNTHLIPNGAAYELFCQAAGANPQHNSAKPIFGFVGMLQDCIAYDYLLALADAYPLGEIILIGKVMPGVDISALSAKDNIQLLGLIPQEQLPEQMHKFDVCLNLFASGRLSKDVSPLKFYEYLATGKPVVSTPEPLQVRNFADIVYVAEDVDDFIDKCGEALTEDDPEKVKKRLTAGKSASWRNRVAQIKKILKQSGVDLEQTEVENENS